MNIPISKICENELPKRYALTNGRIFDGYGFIENRAVIINGEAIESVVEVNVLPQEIQSINLDGAVVSPGFIDLQINGCGGVLYNDAPTKQTLEIMHQTCLKYGCTSFLPTMITCPEKEMMQAVETASAFYEQNPLAILGIHLEGPFISKTKRGAHNAKHIQPIDQKTVNFLLQWVHKIPIVITIAPEENNLSLIRQLALGGVTVSLGHTNATYEQAMEGVANGMQVATHIFNAMSPFESRKPGAVGAVLNTSLYTGIIVDGMHSSFDSVNLVKKIKGERIYIVTDAVTPMGTDIKEFRFADQDVKVVDGKCINEQGALAGSNINMIDSIRNAALHANISEAEALRMATLYPARAMGKNLNIGAIKPGMAANLSVFSNQYVMYCSIFKGKPTIC